MSERCYGFSCFGCRTDFDIPMSKLPADGVCLSMAADYLAGRAGWGIGHWDGQGEIVCGDCTQAVWDYNRFALHPFPPAELRAWLFANGYVAFPQDWTGREPYAWTPGQWLRHWWYSAINWLRAVLIPWRPIEAGEPPAGYLIRARFADGSQHDKCFFTDNLLRKGLEPGWFSADAHCPVGDDSPMTYWRFA